MAQDQDIARFSRIGDQFLVLAVAAELASLSVSRASGGGIVVNPVQ